MLGPHIGSPYYDHNTKGYNILTFHNIHPMPCENGSKQPNWLMKHFFGSPTRTTLVRDIITVSWPILQTFTYEPRHWISQIFEIFFLLYQITKRNRAQEAGLDPPPPEMIEHYNSYFPIFCPAHPVLRSSYSQGDRLQVLGVLHPLKIFRCDCELFSSFMQG